MSDRKKTKLSQPKKKPVKASAADAAKTKAANTAEKKTAEAKTAEKKTDEVKEAEKKSVEAKTASKEDKAAKAKTTSAGNQPDTAKKEDSKKDSKKTVQQTETPAVVKPKRRFRLGKAGKIVITILIAAAAAFALLQVYSIMHLSTSYSVISTVAHDSSSSSSYALLGEDILRYSSDGASLTTESGSAVWNETYDMDTPTADVTDNTAIVYDKKGTSMYMFNKSGLTGSIETTMPILKARVSTEGMVAAILEDGETTWINFYSADGETIATSKTRIDSPGYPVDLDVSENGEILMVSYLYVDGNTPTSYVTFYNFGAAGQNQMDNMVSGYTYEGVMVPTVSFLNSSTAVAIRDDGIILYNGAQIPAEGKFMEEETEIISTFYGSSKVGVIVQSDDTDNPYKLKIYDLSGNLSAEKDFQVNYTKISVADNQVILYNDKQVSIISFSGREKFHGTIDEGTIQEICKVGSNKYMVVMDEGVETIRLD